MNIFSALNCLKRKINTKKHILPFSPDVKMIPAFFFIFQGFYLFIPYLFDPDPDPQIYADPVPDLAKACGSLSL